MAPFNPDVPKTNDPSYIGLSRPISQYEGDTSMGVALKGVGNIIDAGLKATDFLVKEDIQNKVYEAVDLEREAYTSALKYANNSVNPNRPLNLIDDAPQNVPADLQGIGAYLQNLKAARDANKISPTYYYSRLNSHAKALRAQYPGWRDYIDQQFSSISGVNPANAELSARAAELNATAQASKSEKDKIRNLILQNLDIDYAPAIYEGWQSNNISDQDVIKWVHSRKKQEADFKLRKAEREDAQGSREDRRIKAEADFDFEMSTLATNFYENISINGRINGKKIADIIQGMRTGEVEVTTEQAQQLAGLMKQYRDQAFQSMWAKVNTREKDGTTWLSKLGGPDKTRERINGHLTVFDQTIENLSKNRIDLAGMSTEIAKGIQADTKLNLLRQKGLGDYLALAGVVNEMAGSEIAQDLTIEYLKGDMVPDIKTYLNYIKNKAVTQHDIRSTGIPGRGRVEPVKTPFTLNKAIEEANQKGLNVETLGKETTAKVYDEFIKNVELIGKPNVPDNLKLNAMRYAFDPDNRGVLQRFAKDTKDDQGREIPGKHSIFQRMTSPAITKEIFRIGDQELIRNYVAWAQNAFSIDLYRDELRELDNIQLDKDFKLGWDSDNHKFIFKPQREDTLAGDFGAVAKSNFSSFPANVRTQKLVEHTIERLNNGLTNLSNIAKEANMDVNTFLLDFMIRGLGIDPTKGPINFSGHAARAITMSLMKQQSDRASKNK